MEGIIISLGIWLLLWGFGTFFVKNPLMKRILFIIKGYTFLWTLIFAVFGAVYLLGLSKDRESELKLFGARDEIIKQMIPLLSSWSPQEWIDATPFWERILSWEQVFVSDASKLFVEPWKYQEYDLIIKREDLPSLQLDFKNTQLGVNALEIWNPDWKSLWWGYEYIDYSSLFLSYHLAALHHPLSGDFCIVLTTSIFTPNEQKKQTGDCAILSLANVPYSILNIRMESVNKDQPAMMEAKNLSL